MSEQKRNTLTSLGTNKKEKKTKELLKTVRFTLGLPESNEEACPEFHYSALLNSAERKRRAKLKSDGQVNGVDPLAEDESKKLKEIARRFEEKYRGSGKKKHSRYEDYVDLGAGYDETDPFIDNTDAYDEVVPEEMTTAHGGFYINCGALEFKEISDQSDGEELKEFKSKKRLKRVVVLADEEEEEVDSKQVTNSVQVKKPKLQIDEQKEELLKKRKLQSHDREILKKKKKRAIDDLMKKKSVTVKDLLREKRESLELENTMGTQAPAENKKTAVPTSAPALKSVNTSVADVIESVVSAGRDDNTSKDSASSVSKSGSLNTTDSEESQDVEDKEKPTNQPNEEVKLPENLQEDLKELVLALKRQASESSAEGKCKFFSADVNNMLLRVELSCRALTCSSRQAVYGHLASYLPCTKDTLIKRAKKLLIKAEEDKILEAMRKLKNAVDRMMPLVLENYSKQCQRAAEEKSVDELPSPSSDSEIGEGENKIAVQKSKVPRRRFPWTPEIRSLLCEVVRIKLQCLELVKPRKESVDLTLRNFLETEVKPLWQPGWMKVSTLLRESREAHASAVMKIKKSASIKKTATLPPISVVSASNVAVPSVTAYSQNSTVSSTARMKNSPSVSITMTPLPLMTGSGMSTSQVPNTAKLKSATTPEAGVVHPHSVSANITVRTKCATQSQNVNSQTHVISSSSTIPTSVSPSFITSSVRNSPNNITSNKLSSPKLVTSPSVPNKKKTVGDITIAKVSNSSGKSSPNFQPEKQLPLPSVKQKVNAERSPKTLDLSSSSVNRSVTVSSIPGSPSKAKGSSAELISTSCNVQNSVSVTSLPLINIPDCISVTPSLPSPSHVAATTIVSPSTTTTSKPIMLIKQRTQLDTNMDHPSVITKVNPMSKVIKTDDDGIEVIEIVKDARKTEISKATTKPVGRSENSAQAKSELRKKKKEISKDQTSSGTSTGSIQQSGPAAPSESSSHQEKEVERLLKEEEETAAAADFLSQINESLKNFPNSTAIASNNQDVYHDERMINDQEILQTDITKLEPMSSSSAPSPSEHRTNSSISVEEKDKLSSSKGSDVKKKEPSTPQDDEESVQIEVNRVMKELIELQHRHAEKTRVVDLEYSPPKAEKVPPITTNCSSLSVTVSAPVRTQQLKCNKQYTESPVGLPVVGRRSSAGSSDQPKLSYGFQDEFQRHLFQETLIKQESEVSNSYKIARNKTPVVYSQVNQSSVHSSIGSRNNQNSPLEELSHYPSIFLK
ncbi:ubinuclein-1-like isoform X3 [Periplaneta americana]|uniref:ubinuclein-1-like isoform X3 n=1 Tax=Periplaneta americana TaxID=6978 RepID=UPI0037E8A50E